MAVATRLQIRFRRRRKAVDSILGASTRGGLQMRHVRNVALVLALAVGLAAPALAQEAATVVLRSGERVSGELVDMGGSGFAVRVGGSIRRVPTGDVAVVDFGGGASFP